MASLLKFSSRECQVVGQKTRIFIRPPIPEGFVLHCVEGSPHNRVSTEVNFLPPIEVELEPAQTQTSDSAQQRYRATITCGWISFRQGKNLGELLDRLWQADQSLEENLETLLHAGALQLLEAIKSTASLDLTWRRPPLPIKHCDQRRRPVTQTKPVHRISRCLLIETQTQEPKCISLKSQIVEHNRLEQLRGTPSGTTLVQCQINGGCNGTVLPTRALKLSGCDGHHFVCFTCAYNMVRSLADKGLTFPLHCPSYGCRGSFKSCDLLEITAFDTELCNVVEQAQFSSAAFELSQELQFHMHTCPYCDKMTKPRAYVQTYGLLVCPHCDLCWCDSCQYLWKRGVVDTSNCDVSMGRKIYLKRDNPEELEKLRRLHGDFHYKKYVEAWNRQDLLLNSLRPCPKCHVGIEKEYGCNKMVCSQCGAFFCWVCEKPLDRVNPYQHFEENEECQFIGEVIA